MYWAFSLAAGESASPAEDMRLQGEAMKSLEHGVMQIAGDPAPLLQQGALPHQAGAAAAFPLGLPR